MENIRYQTRVSDQAAIDAGLRRYMLSVYNLMVMAMLITGVVAYGVFSLATVNVGGQLALTEFGQALYTSPLQWVIMFAPLGLVFFLGFKINSMSTDAARITFAVYASLVGASISSIFLVFTHQSITQVFFITAAAFGGLSLYGYTTKRNLSGLHSFLVMGVIGLLIAMVVNIFLQSEAMGFIISAVGVLIFAGLTAYDTQNIKETYFAIGGMGEEVAGRTAIMGALRLYLDFLNMFMFLLHLLGNRE